jgi:hypothetical protein
MRSSHILSKAPPASLCMIQKVAIIDFKPETLRSVLRFNDGTIEVDGLQDLGCPFLHQVL